MSRAISARSRFAFVSSSGASGASAFSSCARAACTACASAQAWCIEMRNTGMVIASSAHAHDFIIQCTSGRSCCLDSGQRMLSSMQIRQ